MIDVLAIRVDDWHAGQQGLSGQPVRAQNEIAELVNLLTGRLLGEVCRRAVPPDDPSLILCVARLWTCIEFHWRRLAAQAPCQLADVVQRLESGDLGYVAGNSNILLDVVLAQTLELKVAAAAEMFESQFIPIVRAVAFRAGGQRALDAVDNFSAYLILPRGDRPPRIASYQGRTSLASWLRAVVLNFWTSEQRRSRSSNNPVVIEIAGSEVHTSPADDADCGRLLEPIFTTAVGDLEPEERLILKMLILDEVPQHRLAASLGINSGTLTRRRQRAVACVFEKIRDLSAAAARPTAAANCLEHVLVQGHTELRERLTGILAAGIRADSPTSATDPAGIDGQEY